MSEGGYRDHFRRVHLRKDKTNPRRLAYLFLLLFAVPPEWPLMLAGTLLALAGIAFHGWAAGYLARAGYEDRETVLTLLGPYRHNRNPYYVAHMVMDLGIFCVAGLAPLYLLYGPLMFLVYRRWVLNEEPFLRREFGAEYDEMCREVPRWGIRLTPAAPRGPDQRFTWAMYRFNGEHWRTGSHLLWLGVFWLFWFAGNPFAMLPALVPATLFAVIAAHYLLHDITPKDVSRLGRGWLALAMAIAVGGAVFLARAPVWQPWGHPWDWVGWGLGLLLGALLLVAMLASRPAGTSGDAGEPFRVPVTGWYLAALALGLASTTLGGIWLALLVAATVWALAIAGVITVAPLPRHGAAASAWLLVLGTALYVSFPLCRGGWY